VGLIMGVVDAGIQWDPKLFSYLGSCSDWFRVLRGVLHHMGKSLGSIPWVG